jgi:hypothetical protein
MDELASYRTFSCFVDPVDPLRDECPDYPDKVKHPMDLSKVRHSLEADRYVSVSNWRLDMSLIWSNARTYNHPSSLIGLAAQHLEDIFKSLSELITDNEVNDWSNEMARCRSRLEALLAAVPPGLPRPLGPEPPVEPEKRRRRDDVRRRPKQKVAPADPVAQKKLDRPQVLSWAELSDLALQINDIEDENHISQVIDLIKRYEPDMDVETNAERDITDFSMRTLIALRELVTQWIGT